MLNIIQDALQDVSRIYKDKGERNPIAAHHDEILTYFQRKVTKDSFGKLKKETFINHLKQCTAKSSKKNGTKATEGFAVLYECIIKQLSQCSKCGSKKSCNQCRARSRRVVFDHNGYTPRNSSNKAKYQRSTTPKAPKRSKFAFPLTVDVNDATEIDIDYDPRVTAMEPTKSNRNSTTYRKSNRDRPTSTRAKSRSRRNKSEFKRNTWKKHKYDQIYNDITFEWELQKKSIEYCNHKHFLYVVSVVIDRINNGIKKSKRNGKLLYNKPTILSYLHSNSMDGISFKAVSAQSFVQHMAQIVFQTKSDDNDFFIRRLKQQYAHDLYQKIVSFNLHSLHQSSPCRISFRPSLADDASLRTSSVSIMSTLNQYQRVYANNCKQREQRKVMDALNECNDKISSILDTKWTVQTKNEGRIWHHSIQSIKECTVMNMLYVLDCILNDRLSDKSKETTHALRDKSAKILQYFEDNTVNGAALMAMEAKQQHEFAKQLNDFLDSKGALKDHLVTLCRVIRDKVNVFAITAFHTKSNLQWNERIRTIKQCKEEDLIYIVLHLLSEPSLAKLREDQDHIIAYFVKNHLNGAVFDNVEEQVFVDQLYKSMSFRKKASLIKLYHAIKRCPMHDMANISSSINDVQSETDGFRQWHERSNFENIDRVGFKWDDGVIVVADILSRSTQEKNNRIQIQVKNGLIIYHLRVPFWVTLPSDKLCKPSHDMVERSHHSVFNKWMRIFRIKQTLRSPFEENVFRDMVRLSQSHPRLLFTVRERNYVVPLKHKTCDHVLQSLVAWSLATHCRRSRCYGKPKLDCYCNANRFQRFTYNMMMTVLSDKSDSIINIVKTGSDHTSISTQLCELLPPDAHADKSYYKSYEKHVQRWLLHDFYNIICSQCGNVHKSIMINRVFHYSSTLKNCRTCGVIMRAKDEFKTDDGILDLSALGSKPNKTDSILWFCSQNKNEFAQQGIKVSALKKALNGCSFTDNISKHQEHDLLNLLASFLKQRFDELTYYLSRFLDDMNAWKDLRVQITANYYFYAYPKHFVAVNTLMKETGIHAHYKNIFKDCWVRALFQSTKDNQRLIDLLDDMEEEQKTDVLCTDLRRLQILRDLTPLISAFATQYVQRLKAQFPNTNMDVCSLIQRFLDFKIAGDGFPIMIFNRWQYLCAPESLSYTKDGDGIFIEAMHDSVRLELRNEVGIDSQLLERAKQISLQLQKTKDTFITVQHIHAVLLFAQFPKLRDTVRTLWTEVSIIELHQRFGHLFKLLKEVVFKHGALLKSKALVYYDINSHILCDKSRANVNIPILCSNKPAAFKSKSNQIMAECWSIKPLHCFNLTGFMDAPNPGQEFYIFFGGTCSISDAVHTDRQRLNDDTHSKCKIYSHSQNKWFKGQIGRVFENDEGEWLEVDYGKKGQKTQQKHVRRLDLELRATQSDKWCDHMLKTQHLQSQIDAFFIKLMSSKPNNLFDECAIPYNAELMFRMKTVLEYYKQSQNIIPDFDVFIHETGAMISDRYREHFRLKYMKIKEHILRKRQHRSMKTIVSKDSLIKAKVLTRATHTSHDSDTTLYDVGVFMRYDVHNPRFESLAEEIMFNEVVNISNERFNQHLAKAKEIHSENSLIMLSTADDFNFGIERWQPISISHILSIIIHTEEPHYSRAFTRSCVELNRTDSEITIQHHCNNFYWFGRYIFECVQYFGEILDDHQNEATKQGLSQRFKFDSFAAPINFPRSTTKSMDMALHYTEKKGSVLEWIPKYHGVLNATKFINLSQMSPDYDADTRLFFGRRCAVQINNISFSNGHSLRRLILPLLYLEKIMLQSIFDRQFFNAKHLYDKESQHSDIQATLFNMIQCCMAIHLFHKANAHVPHQIMAKDTQLMIIKRYFPKMIPKEHDEMLYVIDLLEHWCLQRTLVTFESFRAEIPFMIPQLKKLFLWHDKRSNKDVIRIDKLCLIMPNLKHYRNFNKRVIGVHYTKATRKTVVAPKYNGIIDIINDNLHSYYLYNKDFRYGADKKNIGKFKVWCKRHKYDNRFVEQQLQSLQRCDANLLEFDTHFPDPQLDREETISPRLSLKPTMSEIEEDIGVEEYYSFGDRHKYVFEVLQSATKPNLLKVLYPDQGSKYLKGLLPKIDVDEKQSESFLKHSQSRHTTVLSPRISLSKKHRDIKQDDYDAIYRVLSNCQIHELPNEICKILKKLRYPFGASLEKKRGHTNLLALSPTNSITSSLYAYPQRASTVSAHIAPRPAFVALDYGLCVEDQENKRQQQQISKWKHAHSDKLKTFYTAIAKQHQASRDDFIKIAKETKLFDPIMVEKLSEELMDRLFTDIERMKPWKCDECWFLNRKMMIGGLWYLYNQLNECGLCGVERDKKDDEVDVLNKMDRSNTYHGPSSLEPMELEESAEAKEEWDEIEHNQMCSITAKNAITIKMYLEEFTIKEMTQFITQWLGLKSNRHAKQLKQYKTLIINYFKRKQMNGTAFVQSTRKQVVCDIHQELSNKKMQPKLAMLYREIAKHIKEVCATCQPMKRVTFILKQYHSWTGQLHKSNDRYPCSIRQYLAKFGRTQLLDDFAHITQHPSSMQQMKQPYIAPCKRKECIYQKRSKTNTEKYTIEQKRQFLNCEDSNDFEYISYLDKIHCVLFHNMSLKYDKERDIIQRYCTFPVYSTGVYMDHSSLGSLHVNLKQEFINNAVYSMKQINWELDLHQAQNILTTKWKEDDIPRAKETNQIYGIKIGEAIQIEHVLVVYLYTSRTVLCTQFRNSYRTNEFEDNHQKIRSHHMNNFYWMGRFIFVAIHFFGDKPGKDDIFYHGLQKQFLFTQFSTIFEIPTSTSTDHNIAQNTFAREDGIVLSLGPKFKNELNNNKYFNVTSISNYEKEDERLFAGMTVLAVVDIEYWTRAADGQRQCVSLGTNAQVFLYFERIVEQTIHNKNYYNYGFVKKEIQRRYLLPLIKHQMQLNGWERPDRKPPKEIDEQHQYLYALFQHFCDSKRDYINLTCIKDEIETMDKSIQSVLFKQNGTASVKLEINNENIRYIFPKLKGYKNHWEYWIQFDGFNNFCNGRLIGNKTMTRTLITTISCSIHDLRMNWIVDWTNLMLN
eukprot:13992_1